VSKPIRQEENPLKMMKRKPRQFFLLIFAIPSMIGAFALWYLFGWNVLGSWLLCANIVALTIWTYDKASAKSKKWRVPEAALHIMSLLGATPAAFIGMKFMRHKTMKLHFAILYSVLFLLQIALLITWMSTPL
jgi:uncharacterized membrane protein YsdA (DUF1294 family)